MVISRLERVRERERERYRAKREEAPQNTVQRRDELDVSSEAIILHRVYFNVIPSSRIPGAVLSISAPDVQQCASVYMCVNRATLVCVYIQYRRSESFQRGGGAFSGRCNL